MPKQVRHNFDILTLRPTRAICPRIAYLCAMPKRFTLIFTLLVGYIILQFLWWEVLLVKQSSDIIYEKQKLVGLSSTNARYIEAEIGKLEQVKQHKVYMIVGEGTVFLLILLFGIYKVRQAINKETQLTSQQKNFILSVSHELKTPIAATKLQLQTLLKHELDRDKQKQLLNNALSETNRLNKLIEDVLLANQIENDNLSVHKEPFDLSETITALLKNYFADQLAGRQLVAEIQPGIQVTADRVLIPSVAINLIENAIKYSFDKVAIVVTLRNENNQVLLEVKDNGSGIPPGEKGKVFEKFYRSGNEETRKTKGTGLGLYIVKKIVDAHGGRIVLEPNVPQGSIFKIYL
jgi:signal transduction histidine kinase